jgi:hypothetical protein
MIRIPFSYFRPYRLVTSSMPHRLAHACWTRASRRPPVLTSIAALASWSWLAPRLVRATQRTQSWSPCFPWTTKAFCYARCQVPICHGHAWVPTSSFRDACRKRERWQQLSWASRIILQGPHVTVGSRTCRLHAFHCPLGSPVGVVSVQKINIHSGRSPVG